MASETTIFLAGGGTGGHLYPGVAVAEALRDVIPGARPVFFCTAREIDRVILKPTGFEFIVQPIVPPVKTVPGLIRFWRGWRETKELVKRELRARRPAAIIGLGGYAAGVAVQLAANKNVPAALLNQDAIPGKANQYLLKYAAAVCCQFASTAGHVPSEHRAKLRMTGCPIRADIAQRPSREQAVARLGLDPMLRTLVITGASQGAQTVNEGTLAALKSMKLQGWQVLHLAGRDHADAVRAGYRDANLEARVIDFTPAMADVWSAADLAVSRSGASSCAELTACGVPSILMPYPFHKDMHQRANGAELASAGAAILLEDARATRPNAERLRPVLESLMHDSNRRGAMATAAKALGRPDAARAVANVVAELIGARDSDKPKSHALGNPHADR